MVAVVPSFANSFHSLPPRRGLEVLDSKLVRTDSSSPPASSNSSQNAGIRDSTALIKLFRARASSHRQTAHDLLAATPTDALLTYPLDGDDGGSVGRALVALQQETDAQAQAHRAVANEVDRSIVEPFEEWSLKHEERVKEGKKQIFDFVVKYENAVGQLTKTKDAYDSRCALAEEADAESRFTSPDAPPPARPSPKLITKDLPAAPSSKSPKALMSAVSEGDEDTGIASTVRIITQQARKTSVADRLRALTSPDGAAKSPALPAVDEKGKAKETVEQSTAPRMLEIGGVTNGVREWSRFFAQAKQDMPKRSYKLPLLTTYHDVHSGLELVQYFSEHLVDLQKSPETTFEFCRQLSEELGILRLLGELGNKFYDSEDAIYQFTNDAFNLHRLHDPVQPAEESTPVSPFTKLPTPLSPELRSKANGIVGSQGLRRSGTISSYLTTALSTTAKNVNSLTAVANERLSETRQQRLHRDVETAEKSYREAVEKVERARLAMDQAIAVHLPFMQRCEGDRLRHASRAAIAFTAACNPLVRRFQQASEAAATIVNAAQPESDLAATIELYRTGAYRPEPHVFLSHEGAQDANFGIDLRRWEETKDLRPTMGDAPIPPLVTLLLEHLETAYARAENDQEKRMAWIYEVPLHVVHRLRDRLNDPRAINPPTSALEKADAPVLAAVLKLFLLELNPPLIPFNVYDEDLRPLYTHGQSFDDDERSHALKDLLAKVPRLHLLVLDALLQHLSTLIGNTKTGETDEVYRSKLALSLGRVIARPKIDTAISLDDKAPSRFFSEILSKREAVLPEALERRTKRESEQFRKPIRKRTAPVDRRLSRSQLGSNGAIDAEEAKSLLESQLQQHSPARSPPLVKSPPLRTEASLPPTPGLVVPPSEQTSRSATPDFVDAPADQPSGNAVADTLATLEGGKYKTEDPPFVPPEDPPVVPPTEERDQPFMPPSNLGGERDPPFVPPTDDDTPLSTTSASLQRDGSSGLHRGPRIARGPRPPSVAGSGVSRVAGEYKKRESIGSGRVAAAAERFGR